MEGKFSTWKQQNTREVYKLEEFSKGQQRGKNEVPRKKVVIYSQREGISLHHFQNLAHKTENIRDIYLANLVIIKVKKVHNVEKKTVVCKTNPASFANKNNCKSRVLITSVRSEPA